MIMHESTASYAHDESSTRTRIVSHHIELDLTLLVSCP